jgi:hypothetical protein
VLIFPSGVRIDLALGHRTSRKGFDSLAVLVQSELVILRSLPCSSEVKSRCESSGRFSVACCSHARNAVEDSR